MNISKAMLVTVFTFLLAANVEADSIRCDEYVIDDGDLNNIPTMEEVLEKCGQPSSREGDSLYYKEKGVRLDFDLEGRLVSINQIEDE